MLRLLKFFYRFQLWIALHHHWTEIEEQKHSISKNATFTHKKMKRIKKQLKAIQAHYFISKNIRRQVKKIFTDSIEIRS